MEGVRQQYIDMVGRFKEQSKRSVTRIKMILAFTSWYRQKQDTLTEEEKEYLLGKIMPRFVVAGLSSVTTLSIIVAGIFASIL